MLRRQSIIAAIFSFIIFLAFSITPALAAKSSTGSASLNKALGEFCEKRSGNQMNLETWYSGKCQDDSITGEGVGFSDIVILDFAERIMGKVDTSDQTGEQKFKDLLEEVEPLMVSQSVSPAEKTLALENARLKFFKSQGNGLTTQVGSLMSYLMNSRPASSVSYLAYVSENLQKHHIIPSALAAPPSFTGAGFSTMSPFIPLWKATRNLAYTAMVLVFIAYGFMMIFRVNLGQKTAITIQLAIPKLIVTFLIITFSFAIVGFALDLMWVVFWFIYYYLGTQHIIATGNPLIQISYGGAGMILSWLVNSISATVASPVVVENILIGGPSVIGLVTGGLLAFIAGGWIFAIIIIIAVLIGYAKLFFKLLTSFVSLIVSLILGPLILLGNVFPGSNAMGNWFRSVLANVAVFPVTMILLLFSYVLTIQPIVGTCADSPFNITVFWGTQSGNFTVCEWIFGVKALTTANTYINNIPLITPIAGIVKAGFDPDALLALVGIVLLLMGSKYVDIVKDALKVPPFKYGSDIGKALELGFSAVKSVPGAQSTAAYKATNFGYNLAKGKLPTAPSRPGGAATPPAPTPGGQGTP